MKKFECVRCGNCCRWSGCVKLEAAEVDAIAAFLGMAVGDFLEEFTALMPDRQGLTLIEKPGGSCIFLGEGEAAGCRINPVKPRQCEGFPLRWNFPGWEKECGGAPRETEEGTEPMNRLGTVIVLSGPSGVGKSTLVGRVRGEMPELQFSISCTTRPPRAGERHGVHYYFLSHEEFAGRVGRGEFVEHAQVFANRYGTLKSEVLDRIRGGNSVILDIDVQGALQIRAAAESDPELKRSTVFVFIGPPSVETLERRLRGRATDSEEQIELRLKTARHELSFWRSYDYLVVNGDLDTAAAEMTGLFRSFALRTACQPEGLFE